MAANQSAWVQVVGGALPVGVGQQTQDNHSTNRHSATRSFSEYTLESSDTESHFTPSEAERVSSRSSERGNSRRSCCAVFSCFSPVADASFKPISVGEIASGLCFISQIIMTSVLYSFTGEDQCRPLLRLLLFAQGARVCVIYQ